MFTTAFDRKMDDRDAAAARERARQERRTAAERRWYHGHGGCAGCGRVAYLFSAAGGRVCCCCLDDACGDSVRRSSVHRCVTFIGLFGGRS